MTTDAFHAVNTVAQLRSKGVISSRTGPNLEHLSGVELLVQPQIEELGGMLTGPVDLPGCGGTRYGLAGGPLAPFLDDDAATVLQDDFTERFGGQYGQHF